uniref:LO2-3 n=1 Tax=Carp adomavirus TaxID=2609874 RepID=A0A6F9EYL1_9VIRU|nr:TPA_asm: LO2-3 [Carp adomavirus]
MLTRMTKGKRRSKSKKRLKKTKKIKTTIKVAKRRAKRSSHRSVTAKLVQPVTTRSTARSRTGPVHVNVKNVNVPMPPKETQTLHKETVTKTTKPQESFLKRAVKTALPAVAGAAAKALLPGPIAGAVNLLSTFWPSSDQSSLPPQPPEQPSPAALSFVPESPGFRWGSLAALLPFLFKRGGYDAYQGLGPVRSVRFVHRITRHARHKRRNRNFIAHDMESHGPIHKGVFQLIKRPPVMLAIPRQLPGLQPPGTGTTRHLLRPEQVDTTDSSVLYPEFQPEPEPEPQSGPRANFIRPQISEGAEVPSWTFDDIAPQDHQDFEDEEQSQGQPEDEYEYDDEDDFASASASELDLQSVLSGDREDFYTPQPGQRPQVPSPPPPPARYYTPPGNLPGTGQHVDQMMAPPPPPPPPGPPPSGDALQMLADIDRPLGDLQGQLQSVQLRKARPAAPKPPDLMQEMARFNLMKLKKPVLPPKPQPVLQPQQKLLQDIQSFSSGRLRKVERTPTPAPSSLNPMFQGLVAALNKRQHAFAPDIDEEDEGEDEAFGDDGLFWN